MQLRNPKLLLGKAKLKWEIGEGVGLLYHMVGRAKFCFTAPNLL
jgi:hypothetical protein